jgi:hypothetical protein
VSESNNPGIEYELQLSGQQRQQVSFSLTLTMFAPQEYPEKKLEF